jgi:hypothetical protein
MIAAAAGTSLTSTSRDTGGPYTGAWLGAIVREQAGVASVAADCTPTASSAGTAHTAARGTIRRGVAGRIVA